MFRVNAASSEEAEADRASIDAELLMTPNTPNSTREPQRYLLMQWRHGLQALQSELAI